MNSTITIVANQRGKNCDVIDRLCSLNGVNVEIGQLAIGDFQVDRLVFERLTVQEFLHTISGSRFYNQMSSLARSSRRAFLIIEGTANEDHGAAGVHAETSLAALVTVGIILGIPILRSRDCTETALLMLYTARQTRWTGRPVRRQPPDRPEPESTLTRLT
jgi:ERCC4-type nuclease